MHRVVYSMGVSLDGYVVGPDGGFDWAVPDPEAFQAAIDETREAAVHLLGRRLYDTMLIWDTIDQDPELDFATREFAELWRQLPKVVFSTTLTAVEGANTRLASGSLAEEMERLKAQPGDGDIAIGGASLAAAVAELGLIDEYRMRIFPVLVGGGTPYFAHDEQTSRLELIESRTYADSVIELRYRVIRDVDEG